MSDTVIEFLIRHDLQSFVPRVGKDMTLQSLASLTFHQLTNIFVDFAKFVIESKLGNGENPFDILNTPALLKIQPDMQKCVNLYQSIYHAPAPILTGMDEDILHVYNLLENNGYNFISYIAYHKKITKNILQQKESCEIEELFGVSFIDAVNIKTIIRDN